MHKKIALLIDKMIKESPYHKACFTSEVITNPNGSDGFWKIVIYFMSRDNAHSNSLFESLHHIGTVYGEGLNIEDKEDEVIVS